jgi:2-polyprenyl-6-methoxyphenol hydroxylase-like FAD-dependent oxidoreductase
MAESGSNQSVKQAASSISRIIVGPSGLVLALLLARNGINVEILDAGDTVDEQPRATHYAPPAVAELRRAGVIEDIIAAGYKPRDFI